MPLKNIPITRLNWQCNECYLINVNFCEFQKQKQKQKQKKIINKLMGLNRFQQCNSNHKQNFEYCCLKSQKVFCTQCWRTKGHAFQCHSTRCGHYEKLAHLTIDKTLEMKALYYTAQMSNTHDKCQKMFLKFSQLKQYILETIKQDLTNKLPLFLSSFLIEMLGNKSTNAKSLIYEEGTCSEMLKLIRNRQGDKSQNLQAVINGFDRINHMQTAMKENLKNNQFSQQKIHNRNQQNLDEVLRFYHSQALGIISNLKISMKNQIQSEIRDVLSRFDSNIQFQGVKFSNKPNFSSSENFRARSLVLQAFPQLEGLNENNYAGVNLNIETLQQSPELLLETSKNFIKNKLYDIYAEIKDFKSPFPYKFAYIISTTLVPDRQYELLVIDLQKSFVKKVNKIEKTVESSFMNSVNLVIMGPQLIIIQFKNRPRNTAAISIFGAKQQRSKFYEEVMEKIGLKKSEPKKIENRYKFQTQLSPVGLVYAQFELAYEYLFLDQEKTSEFEGQKYAQARGSKLFEKIAQNYRNTAGIDFQIDRNLNQIKQLII